jgi:GTP1/Obg family GTP-binding protein
MSLWRRGPLDKNPYLRNAFRVARVPREVTRHRVLVQLIDETKRVARDPEAHRIAGQPVTETEINAAEQVLLDARQRIAEELLAHAAERPPLEELRKLARQATQSLTGEERGKLVVKDLRRLEGWITALARRFLAALPGPDPSFGAWELNLPPPFGKPEERR